MSKFLWFMKFSSWFCYSGVTVRTNSPTQRSDGEKPINNNKGRIMDLFRLDDPSNEAKSSVTRNKWIEDDIGIVVDVILIFFFRYNSGKIRCIHTCSSWGEGRGSPHKIENPPPHPPTAPKKFCQATPPAT
ncbi:MAG: hypothetical protein GY820_06695 [Gammaproteobacteria bacterium]|nr:hypothetical protein [Gammaproteobacteria bacterium]